MRQKARQIIAKETIEHEPTRVQRARVDRGDEPDDRSNRKNIAASRVVPSLQKLRHRINPGSDVIRQKNEEQQAINDPDVPIPRRQDDAELVSAADIRDKLFAADVCRDHRTTDDKPWDRLVP